MAIIFNIILVTATCQMTGQHVAADVPTRPAHVLGQVGQRVVLGQAGVKCAGQGPQGKQAKQAQAQPAEGPQPNKKAELQAGREGTRTPHPLRKVRGAYRWDKSKTCPKEGVEYIYLTSNSELLPASSFGN